MVFYAFFKIKSRPLVRKDGHICRVTTLLRFFLAEKTSVSNSDLLFRNNGRTRRSLIPFRILSAKLKGHLR